MIDRAAAIDQAVTDVCEWLDFPRTRFFELARQWERRGPELWAQSTPETFYRSWTGADGQANLCANILDQFSRATVWSVLHGIFTQSSVPCFLDFGCGSAALSFPFLPGCQRCVLVDVPNLAQEFLRWRTARDGLSGAAILTPDEAAGLPDQVFDFVACVDVLEHLPQPTVVFEQLDRQLKLGGLYLHRAPWARPDEDFSEHLPEAPLDWHRPGGGGEQIAERYRELVTIEFGGLYLKQRNR